MDDLTHLALGLSGVPIGTSPSGMMYNQIGLTQHNATEEANQQNQQVIQVPSKPVVKDDDIHSPTDYLLFGAAAIICGICLVMYIRDEYLLWRDKHKKS